MGQWAAGVVVSALLVMVVVPPLPGLAVVRTQEGDLALVAEEARVAVWAVAAV